MDAMLDTGSALKDEQRGQPAPDSKQLHGEVQPPQRIRTKLARPRLFVCIHGCRFGAGARCATHGSTMPPKSLECASHLGEQ
ncbi:hypothetical protein V8C40DRAFT_112295 [Trichoderma camerunense]